jgi:hypothetical protein
VLPQPAPPKPQSLADQYAEDAQYYRRLLHGVLEIGATLANLLPEQVQSATPSAERVPEIARVAIAFDRIARTIRRTITLARKVAEPIAPTAERPDQHRAAARRRIIREVEDVIQRTPQDADAETLHAELLDRLDGPDLDDDIANRPIADIIADICRDLGLAAMPGTHPWKRRTVEDLAALSAQAAQPRAAQPRTAQPRTAPVGALCIRPTPPHAETSNDPPLTSSGQHSRAGSSAHTQPPDG